MAISAAQLTVQVDADTKPAEAGLNAIDALIQRLVGNQTALQITANTSAADAALSAVSATVDQLAAAVPDILVDVDTSAATAGIDEVLGDLSSVAADSATAIVDADVDGALSGLEAVEATAAALAGESATVHVTADTAAATESVSRFSGALSNITQIAAGINLGNAIANAPAQLLDMAKAAADDAASVTRLHTAVDNGAGGWTKYGTQIDAAIKRGQELAFSDDQVRDALSNLTAQTGNAGDALDRLAVAENFARGANIDLSTASRLLGKVTDESASALARYGIHVQAGATAQEALNAVDARFQGQAGAFAASDAGKFAIMSDKVGELQEALGAKLLPAVSAVVDAGIGLVDFGSSAVAALDPLSGIVGPLGAAMGGALALGVAKATAGLVAQIPALYADATAWLAVNSAALPWIALAAALGVGIYELVKHWDDLTARFPILQTGLDAVKQGFSDFVDILQRGGAAAIQLIENVVGIYVAEFQLLLAIFQSVGQVAKDFFTFNWGDIGGDVTAAFDAIGGAAGTMKQAVLDATNGVQAAWNQTGAATTAATSAAVASGADYVENLYAIGSGQQQAAETAAEYNKRTYEQATAADATAARLLALDQQVMAGTDSWFDYASGAQSAWAAQSDLNDLLGQASGQVSFWQGNLAGAEGALKILNDQVASGIPLSAKQSDEYDTLTWAVGRYQGGVEDSQGAVVDAATAQADFIKIQDDLNGKLAAGTISQGDYNKQMADAAGSVDPAAAAAYNLAGAQDTVATAINGVVDKLGNMLIDLGLLPESKRTDFQTPGLDDANTDVGNLGEGIGALPSSFTITANVDIAPAMDRVQQLRDNLPFSPAKEGPFSTLPDWQFLMWTLPAAFDTGVAIMADGGTRMLQSLSSSASAELNTAPTIGDLILAAASAGVDPLAATGELAGKDVVDALVNGVVSGLPEWQNIFELMHGDALTALAAMQTDLQGKIRLAGIAGEDTADLQAKLDAVSAIIATWAEQTGLDFNEEVTSMLAPDVSGDVTQAWLDMLGHINDIVSGDFQTKLQDSLAQIQNELTVAVATGAPQAVIDALTSQQAAIEAQLQEAGLAYQAAIDAGMTDPDAWQQTQEKLKQQVDDTLSYFDNLSSGDALTQAQAAMDKANQELAIANATGASQDVIAAIMKEFVDAQAAFNKAAGDTSTLIAKGLASPEAIDAYNEAMGIVTQIPVDQLTALLPQMSDFGVSLLDELSAGVADGSTTLDDALSVVNGIMAASLSDLDATNDLAVSDMVAKLQELEAQLTGDLADALVKGSDPSAIEANLSAIDQMLAALNSATDESAQHLAELGGYLNDTAAAMGNVAAGAKSMQEALTGGLVGGAYTGGGIGGNGTSGGDAGAGAFFNTGGPYPVAAPAVKKASAAPAVTVVNNNYVTLDGAAIATNVENRGLAFARAM